MNEFRILRSITVVLTLSALIHLLTVIALAGDCGIERWDVKTLNDTDASKVNISPKSITVKDLVSLPTVNPGTTAARRTDEMQVYSLLVHLTFYKYEDDRDIHLVVRDPFDSAYTLVAEIPSYQCSSSISSGYADIYKAAYDSLSASVSSSLNLNGSFHPLDSTVTYIITGVGYYDPAHGQRGRAVNNIEIHPVLSLRRANTSDVEDSSQMTGIQLQGERVIINVTEPFTACIIDIRGKVVWTHDYQQSDSVDLPELNHGTYFFRVETESKIKALKFVR